MTNNTTQLSKGPCELHFKETVLLTLYILVILLGVVGNAAIIYVFGFRHKHKKTVTELLILYLAMSDFLASIFGPFIFIYWISTCHCRWDFGIAGCKLLPLFSRVFINVSVGIILILSIDRYRAICTPFRGQFHRNYIRFAILVTIVLSVGCEFYYIDALTVQNGPSVCGCVVVPRDKNLYRKITSAILLTRDLIFIVTFSMTTISIAFTIHKRDVYFTGTSTNVLRHETSRVVRVVIVMELVFLLLVLPRDVLHILFSLSWLDGNGIDYSRKIINLNEFLKVFQTANCCANIFIYAKLHDRFRSSVLEVIQNSIGKNRFSESTATMLCYKRQLLSSQHENNNGTYQRKLLRKNVEIQSYKRTLLMKCELNGNRNTEMSFMADEDVLETKDEEQNRDQKIESCIGEL